MPVAGEELLFEMTVNCLLMPKSGGVPTWRSDQVGEKLMMKLPKQFESTFAEQKPLDESTGRALAQWAKGGQSSTRTTAVGVASEQPAPPVQRSPQDGAGDVLAEIERSLTEAAGLGMDALQEEWKTLAPKHQAHFKAMLDRVLKPMAQKAPA